MDVVSSGRGVFARSAATNAELYFASDKNGQNRVTNVQEGSQVWIVVYDPDENIDCDVRDKIWTDVKVMDPKTGAYIDWALRDRERATDVDRSRPTDYYHTGALPRRPPCRSDVDYFEETGADTGLFVSSQPIQIGTRLDYAQRPR